MTTFTIDSDNNISALGSAEETAAATAAPADSFGTQKELAALITGWPAERLVAIWNGLPGVEPVKKFKSTKTAASHIWERIQSLGTATEPKPTAKAKTKKGKPAVPPAKAKSAKKATKAKKAADTAPQAAAVAPKKAKAGKRATAAEQPAQAREGSKTAQILELLKRPGGATLKSIMAATAWQAHSVRGFISGTLGKKLKLVVESVKAENGERTYSLKG